MSPRNKGKESPKLHPRPFLQAAWFAFSAEAANAGWSAEGELVTLQQDGLSFPPNPLILLEVESKPQERARPPGLSFSSF